MIYIVKYVEYIYVSVVVHYDMSFCKANNDFEVSFKSTTLGTSADLKQSNFSSFFFPINIIVQHSKLKSHSHQAPKF